MISVPARALVNARTLGPFYANEVRSALSSSQLLSLQLALSFANQARPSDEIDPTKGRFLPFVKTLPRSFDTVPLIWELSSLDAPELEQRYDARLDERPTSLLSPGLARKLMALLPPKAKDCAFDVESRFRKDWLRVKQVLVSMRAGALRGCLTDRRAQTGRTDVPLTDFSNFCIAWLNGQGPLCLLCSRADACRQ